MDMQELARKAAEKKAGGNFGALAIAARNRRMAQDAGVSSDPARQAEIDAMGERDLARAQIGRPAAAMVKAAQGGTLGFMDEALGVLGGDQYRDTARNLQDLASTAYPGQSVAAEIAGSMAIPGGAVTKPSRAIMAGTAAGTTYAAGNAEEGERLEAAMGALPESLLFSAGGVTAQRFLSSRLGRTAKAASERPTANTLRTVRDQAYREVDQSGFKFTKEQFDEALGQIYSRLDAPDSSYVRGDTKVERALKLVERNWGSDMTLGELDNVRKRVMKTWASAGPDEADAIMDIVGVIDDMIEGSGVDPVMRAAREAHKTFMRVDFLEKAFQKADNNTAVSGSGGNIYNNYGRVFKNILGDERKARMFTPEMREFMQAAIDTPVSEAAMRKLGKLSPDGNGLMLALSVIGGTIEPSMLAFSAGGAGAKVISDRKMTTRVEDMMRLAAGMPPAVQRTTPTQVGVVPAIAGQQEY